MMEIRKSNERGHFDHGWLNSYHSFSFADYYDPNFMGFRSLRVINEDWVAAGKGFDMHPHRDMEILTWVLSGSIKHEDSMGRKEILRPGELQRMSAGKGVLHSEANPSESEPLHLLQIWVVPDRKGVAPRYDQKAFDLDSETPVLLASPDGREGSLPIYQDLDLRVLKLSAGKQAIFNLKPGRYAWVQVARGEVELLGSKLEAGDAAAITEEAQLTFKSNRDSEVLLFDMV